MPDYALSIHELGREDAAGEVYRRVVSRDKIDPIIEKLDRALKTRDRGKKTKPTTAEVVERMTT